MTRVLVTERRDPLLLTLRLPPPRSRWAAAGLAVAVVVDLAVVFYDYAAVNALRPMVPSLGRFAVTLAVALVFLVPVNAIGLGALWMFAYRLRGREVVAYDGFYLRVQRTVAGIGRRGNYGRERVGGLRPSPMAGGPFDEETLTRRGVLFDYRGRVRSFGAGLTPDEAAEACERLREAMGEKA